MTAREQLTELGWIPRDGSEKYERGVFLLLEALVKDAERLQGEVTVLRAQLSHVGYVVEGGGPS